MNTFNRRDFIKMAGTAAGGLVLSSGMLSAQRKGGDKVNVAVVGYGAEGEVLMNSLLKLPTSTSSQFATSGSPAVTTLRLS